MLRIRFSMNTVLMPGRMIALNCCQRLAPSMVAASYSVGSMEAMAPMNSTMFWPQYFHTLVKTRLQLLMLWSRSQYGRLSRLNPMACSTESSTNPRV